MALTSFGLMCASPEQVSDLTGPLPVPKRSEPNQTEALSWGAHESIKDCLSCHNQLPDDAALKTSIPQLCTTCHTRFSDLTGWIHGPVAAGQCVMCHEPHQAVFPSLLTLKQPDLCFQCHETATMALIENHTNPAYAQCSICHAAHVGPGRMLLRPEFIKAQELLSLMAKGSTPTQTRLVGASESLQGLQAVQIDIVIDRAKRFAPYGLTEKKLHDLVETSLRQSKVPVSGQGAEAGQTATLTVHLKLVEIPSPQSGQIAALSGSLQLRLQQTVKLAPLPEGNTERTCRATTWETGGLVVWDTRLCQEGLSKAVKVFATRFTKAYHSGH